MVIDHGIGSVPVPQRRQYYDAAERVDVTRADGAYLGVAIEQDNGEPL
jgi:hypothetical protein